MRREFTAKIKEQAYERSGGHCEVRWCGAALTTGRIHYDHIIPCALGGEPTLANCQVICTACHKAKTTKEDIPRIAKAKRVRRKHIGIRKRSSFACSRQSRFKKKLNGEVVLR